MPLIEVEGDLFAGDYPAVGHGVNCWGLMSAGIAKEFASRYPGLSDKYKAQCEFGMRVGDVYPFYAADKKIVMNIASQDRPGSNASLTGVAIGVHNALTMLSSRGFTSLAIPAIGCGIGGLEYPAVRGIFVELAQLHPGMDLIIVRRKEDTDATVADSSSVSNATGDLEGDLHRPKPSEGKAKQGGKKKSKGKAKGRSGDPAGALPRF